jgi:hypothetical protein
MAPCATVSNTYQHLEIDMSRDYVTVQLKPAAREALQGAKLQVSGAARQAATLSATVVALVTVGLAHLDDLASALPSDSE